MEDIKRCSHCGKPIIDQFVFCPFCGEEIAPKCKNCGEPLIEGAAFCSKCGAKVRSTRQETEIVQPHLQEVKDENYSLVEVKPERKKKKHSVNSILTLTKRATVALVCVILFALSFLGVFNLSLGSYLNSIVDEDYIEGDVSIYAVDCVELMIASARHYDEEDDASKIEKLKDELADLQDDLLDSASDDLRGEKIVLSVKTESLFRKYVVKTIGYQLSIDNATASGSARAEFIVAGALFLSNIVFTFIMTIFALIAFFSYLSAFLSGEEKDNRSKLDFFVPFLMILPLCGMLPLASAISVMDIAAAMIASLFFSSLAIVACITQRLVADTKIAKTAKILIPRIAMAALAFIVVGCCFAPCFKAIFDVKFDGKTAYGKYETTLDASAMAGYITTEEQQKTEYYKRQYERYTEEATAICQTLESFTSREFMANDAIVAKAFAQILLVDGVLAQISYEAADIISLGFFLLILVMLLSGIYLGCTVMGGKSAKAANLGLAVSILILLLCSLATSIVTTELVNKTMKDIKLDTFELQLAGGIISAIVMSVIMIVFSAIPSRVWERKQNGLPVETE